MFGILALIVALVATGYGVHSWMGQPFLFAVIGNDGKHLQREREMGVNAKVVRLSWRDFYSSQGKVNHAYVRKKKKEIQNLRDAGFKIILSLNYQDTPSWVHKNYPNSYYVNQFGEKWTGTRFSDGSLRDQGDANLVFNTELRGLVASYIKDVFSRFGTDFYAVRIGGGRYGEVSYPPDKFHGKTNLYWAYDKNAQKSAAKAGVAGWRPGEPSPDGQASKFLNWYENSLVGYQRWQIKAVRNAGYTGRIMVLYPAWGVRPGQEEEAIRNDLKGTTPAEKKGEIQRGHDFARQVAAIRDKNVVVVTTYLDASASGDGSHDPRKWSPVKYLHSLREVNPVHPEMYGENTGAGSLKDMLLAASQMRRYGLIGMAWYDEQQLFSGRYATPAGYSRVIRTYQESGR